ncbi:WD40 repeat-like protein [Lophium mytilinum]|uniref:WD40 repeat-like protein n=1 Tax=Lophium mytilinum TaxID=390894 RepID=A0A6A6QIR6_9PEZI|nr:WD40 repeat-like protein [Lophium mytilinum]
MGQKSLCRHSPVVSRNSPGNLQAVQNDLLYLRSPVRSTRPETNHVYLDPDKKKYFAILPEHKGPRPLSRYSKDNITKADKRLSGRQWRKEREEKMKRQRVQRSKTRPSHISALCMRRELGLQQHMVRHKDPRPDAFVGGLEATVLRLPSGSSSRILYFDVDPVTNVIYTAKSDRTIESFSLKSGPVPVSSRSRQLAQPQKLPHGTDLGTWTLADFERLVGSSPRSPQELPDIEHPYKRYHSGHRLHCLTSEVSSMSICHNARTLVTTSLGSDRNACIHLSSLDHAAGISETFTPSQARTVWTAAPSPSSDNYPPVVAVAESNAVRLLNLSPAGGWQSSIGFKTSTDARALAWLSPTMLAVGLRDGSVHLYDPRSEDTRICLNHPHIITNLRRADDPTRLVVAAGRNEMLLYDLRMTIGRADVRTKKRKTRPGRDHFSVAVPSTPVFRFDHSFPPTDRQAIDVHSELGLAAAGRDDGAVCLYSLKTGELIKSFVPARIDFRPDGFLRFVDDERGVPKIMCTRGNDVIELAW